MSFLWESTIRLLPLRNDICLTTLNQYSEYDLLDIRTHLIRKHSTMSSGPQALYIAWKKIAIAARKINTVKADQLCQIAGLLEKYPKILKRSTDPSQQARPNTKHMVMYFRKLAELERGYLWLGEWPCWDPLLHRGGSIFTSATLPIVPFDSCLRLFCRKMHENPPLKPADGSHNWVCILQPLIAVLKLHDSF